MKYANCGASVKSSGKVKKMATGGFMGMSDSLQKMDIDKKREKQKKAEMSSGGIAQKKKEAKAKKDGKTGKRGELVEASYGKAVRKKKK